MPMVPPKQLVRLQPWRSPRSWPKRRGFPSVTNTGKRLVLRWNSRTVLSNRREAQQTIPWASNSVTILDILLYKGLSVAAGYLGGEEFHGRFVTGDIGYFENGYLWYVARCDDQIKYKGYRIEPGEIEAALTALPGIHQAVVLPRKDRLGRVISLQAVAAATGEPQEEQVRQALASMLPEYMVPRRILFCRALPITVNGKIDRRKAAALLDQSTVPTDEKERNKCFT